MDCDRLAHLLSKAVGGALEDSERLVVDAHLETCVTCRERLAALREDDALLREAIGRRRDALGGLAQRTIARLRREDPVGALPDARREADPAGAPRSSAGPAPTRRRFVPGWILGAAAGFIVAVLIFRPWEDRPRASFDAAPAAVARLAFATAGGIEARVPSAARWAPVRSGSDLAPGSRLRTPPDTRCELQLGDGSLVRLDAASELVLVSTRSLALASGRLWTRVNRGRGAFLVEVPGARARVTALGTAFEVAANEEERARVLVLEGTTRVEGSRRNAPPAVVGAGETIEVVAGELRAKEAADDLLLATSWIHEILVLKGRNDPELARRIDDLFAQIGEQKMTFLYEKEIRALGDHCAVPMARYLQSERSEGHTEKRRAAARILADVAPPSSVPDLIELLADRQAEVRFHAERALCRLAEREGPRSLAEWRDTPSETIARVQAEWRAWWEANEDRFPPGP